MTDGYVGHWDGEDWVYFHWAASEISDKLAIPSRSAKAHLRKLCASGEIRAISSAESDLLEEPEPIPPSRWRDEDIAASWRLLIAVSRNDLRNWLSHQSSSRRQAISYHPTACRDVSERCANPRRLPTRGLEGHAGEARSQQTLKTAIDAFNRQLGNTRNESVSD